MSGEMMSKPSVVLVEDEIILASLVMQALDDYEVIHCNRAEQFRGIITDQDPDLIIMDIELGEGENGYDLCAWYRDNHSKAQILFLSTMTVLMKLPEPTSLAVMTS
jgi:DNA-binding response OmpR family regulator